MLYFRQSEVVCLVSSRIFKVEYPKSLFFTKRISRRVHQALSSSTKQYFWSSILLHRATENKSPSQVFAYICFAFYTKITFKKLVFTGKLKKSWELIFKRNRSSYVKTLESQVLYIGTRRLTYAKLFISYIIAWNSLLMFVLRTKKKKF